MAQEKYGLFNSTEGDVRQYYAEDVATAFKVFAIDGVSCFGTCLQVTAEGSTMRTLVGYGRAFVQGHYYSLLDDGNGVYAVTHSAASGLDRIDRIVLRYNKTANTITLVKLSGTPASTPVAPSLTRDATAYEISLAQVRVRVGATQVLTTDITDERPNEAVCGAALPESIKFSQLWTALSLYAAGFDALRINSGQTLTTAEQLMMRTKLGAQQALSGENPLAVAVGGTGVTTLKAIKNALGLSGEIADAIAIANGGTGAKTAAAARNNLGLGNTAGAVPVANGGTGADNASSARTNLGLGNLAVRKIQFGFMNVTVLANNAVGWSAFSFPEAFKAGTTPVIVPFNASVVPQNKFVSSPPTNTTNTGGRIYAGLTEPVSSDTTVYCGYIAIGEA
ncbi:MAG TPA: hypothetical protein PKN45_12665 [Candidatus Limiplasma sp.]|nr:hypothetical protein [Candidatus Limiplasma sp.]